MPASTRSGPSDPRTLRRNDREATRDLALRGKKKTPATKRVNNSRIVARAPKRAFEPKEDDELLLCSAAGCNELSRYGGRFVDLACGSDSMDKFAKVDGWCGSSDCERVVNIASGKSYVGTDETPVMSPPGRVLAEPEDFEPDLTFIAGLRNRLAAVQREEANLDKFVALHTDWNALSGWQSPLSYGGSPQARPDGKGGYLTPEYVKEWSGYTPFNPSGADGSED